MGFIGYPWLVCLLTAFLGIFIYYGVKIEGALIAYNFSGSLLGIREMVAGDILKIGFIKWFLWIYSTQLFTATLFYFIGYGVSALFK
jgi:hypothetical protein